MRTPNDSVRSVRDEGLSKVIPIGQAMLRRALPGYVTHHLEGNHQGLANALITPLPSRERSGSIRHTTLETGWHPELLRTTSRMMRPENSNNTPCSRSGGRRALGSLSVL
jgi:hypothetical protein